MLERADRNRHCVSMIRAAFAAVALALPMAGIAAQEPAAQMPATHTVKRGDTLWDVAKAYLGDSFLWPEIYRLNTDVIEDPHWIYPGETLKLPGITAKVVAVTPPAAATPDTAPARAPVVQAPTPEPATAPARTAPARPEAPTSNVRAGEYLTSPWVDQPGGPRVSGHIMQSGDLTRLSSAMHERMQLYDRVVVAPPAGSDAREHEHYLVYRLGPNIEDFGQVVIPTGVIEVTRAATNGEAALGRVVKMFGEVVQGQHLIPYDSAAAVVADGSSPVVKQRSGTVRWILSQPELPSLQSYVIVDITKQEGVATGDQIELYEPRQRPAEGETLAIPEVFIARARVLRVTPLGATAIITSQEQATIATGTNARVTAKMP